MSNKDEGLSDLNLPPMQNKVIRYIGKEGKDVSEDAALAKTVTCNYGYEDLSIQFFVKVGRGELIDPYQVDYGITKGKLNSIYKYKKVSEKAFNAYVKFLQNKNRIHFTNARRLIME